MKLKNKTVIQTKIRGALSNSKYLQWLFFPFWLYHYLHSVSLVLSKSTGMVLVGGFQKSENIYSHAEF